MIARFQSACLAPVLVLLVVACSGGGGGQPVDAADIDAPPDDAATAIDAADRGPLGSATNPAATCADILAAVGPKSGIYWLRHPDGMSPQFAVFCEQTIEGGGWAMVYNSVPSSARVGPTIPFWQFFYADRFKRFGVQAADRNYYDGSLYLLGKEYMDVFVDIMGKQAVGAMMTTTGIDQTTMKFGNPMFKSGQKPVFDAHFAAGWSCRDHDDDTAPDSNCALSHLSVAQHYSACWIYNLGADADPPDFPDGGWGPHVHISILMPLGLAGDPTVYSRVNRIARFTRWDR